MAAVDVSKSIDLPKTIGLPKSIEVIDKKEEDLSSDSSEDLSVYYREGGPLHGHDSDCECYDCDSWFCDHYSGNPNRHDEDCDCFDCSSYFYEHRK